MLRIAIYLGSLSYGVPMKDMVASDGLMTADAIIAEVNRLGADLLGLGAQAEGGLRQWFHSSVSRQVLADANIPLLIAN